MQKQAPSTLPVCYKDKVRNSEKMTLVSLSKLYTKVLKISPFCMHVKFCDKTNIPVSTDAAPRRTEQRTKTDISRRLRFSSHQHDAMMATD